MEFEPMDEFERELREAFERRPAPPSLKRKVMDRRRVRSPRPSSWMWQRWAASLALAAIIGGGALEWNRREREEQRKGQAAREQVLTALRITGHALNQMNSQLAARGHEQ